MAKIILKTDKYYVERIIFYNRASTMKINLYECVKDGLQI